MSTIALLSCAIVLLLNSSSVLSFSNELIGSNNEFAFDLFHSIDSNSNQFICPLIIQQSLYKLLCGSKQQTRQQLQQLLHVNEETPKVPKDVSDIRELIKQSKNPLKIANKFFISNKYELNKEFIEKLNDFNSTKSFESVNFKTNTKNVTKLINEYVSTKTDGKIGKLIADPLSEDLKLVLINAVYLNANNWLNQFDSSKTEKSEFLNFQSSSLIEMMKLNGLLRIQTINELNAQLIELPFNQNQQTFYILLPSESDGIEEMNEKLTNQLFQQSIQSLNNTKPQQIQLFFPKFKIENEYGIREALEDLDVKSLYDSADLTGISNDNTLSLSLAIHHTIIEVNENEVKGEPAQEVPESRVIRVNRPFTFIIQSNGLIVFIGQVMTLVDENLLTLGFI